MFKVIKVTTKSSNWTTSINPNMDNNDIKNHFINKYFDIGIYPIEKMEKCTKIEFLYSATFNGTILGAIGEKQTFKNIEVFGDDEIQAELNLYDNYEHLSNISIAQVIK